MRWLKRKKRDEELDRELRSHLDLEAEERLESGLPPDEARHAARRAFGNVTLAKEDTRAAWGWIWLERLGQDLRYAGRVLRRRPGFTVAAVASLALGIGANTAVFSLLHALLLARLPVERPQELVRLDENGGGAFAYPDYDRLRRGSRHLAAVIGMSRHYTRPTQIEERGETREAYLQMVSDDFFDVLEIGVSRGRVFHADNPNISGKPVAVISESYWRRRYGSDPAALGARFRYLKTEFTVVGIAPAAFLGAEVDFPTDIWVPMEQALAPGSQTRLVGRMFRVMGHLRPEATAARAESEASGILSRPVKLLSGATGYSDLRGRLLQPLLLLELVVGMVLLITCANLANLVLAGATAREHELAARQAVGASRSRVVRQLFTESIVLAAAGGAFALLAAKWMSAGLLSFLPPDQAPALAHLRFQPDPRILAFALLLSFVTCLLFGLVPALRVTRAQASLVLRAGAGAGQTNRSWLSRSMLASEVAMCALLLMVSGVFVRSLQNLRGQDTGYRENGLLVADVAFPREYREARRDQLFEDLRARVSALPGVETVAFSHFGQMSGAGIEYRIRVPGTVNRDDVMAFEHRVSPGFLDAMGTVRKAGRDFTETDDARSAPVAIVNEEFARQFLPGGNPIGQRFSIDRVDRSRSWEGFEIVGVVKDAKWISLREAPQPMYYRPYRQSAGRPMARFAIRASGDLRALAAGLVQTAQALDRQMVLKDVVPFSEIVNRTLVVERLVAHVSGAFGILALLIAAVGLYGVLAYSVVRRRREIGVRIAVGASPATVQWMVLRESFASLAVGFAIGVPAAILVTRFVSKMLFGLSPGDPTTISASLAALAITTLAAAWLPARRAANVDPILALRAE